MERRRRCRRAESDGTPCPRTAGRGLRRADGPDRRCRARRSGEKGLAAYSKLDFAERRQFFVDLRDRFNADPDAIRKAFAAYDADSSARNLVPLFDAVEPPRQTLLRRLDTAPGATLRLVNMCADLLDAMQADPKLGPLDADFAHLFSSWFNRNFLRIERIDWSTSASVLEKIMEYETEHPMKGWTDMRRRVEPADRRLYAFFHPATGASR